MTPGTIGRIPDIPDVVLENIFRHVRQSQSPRTLVICMLVSKRCHNLAQRILLRHLTVTDQNIAALVERMESNPAIFGPVFHLTIKVHIPYPMPIIELVDYNYSEEMGEDVENEPTESASDAEFAARKNHRERGSSPNPDLLCLEARLRTIASTIKSDMRKLQTFSLTIDAEPLDGKWCGCYEPVLPQSMFTAFAHALPKDCLNLEIDSGGTDTPELRPSSSETYEWSADAREHDGSFCESMRSILPQLEHCRLRMCLLCPQTFFDLRSSSIKDLHSVDDSDRQAQGIVDRSGAPHLRITDGERPVRLLRMLTRCSKLETLVINMSISPRGKGVVTCLFGQSLNGRPCFFEGSDTPNQLALLLHTALPPLKDTFFPRLTKCLILDSMHSTKLPDSQTGQSATLSQDYYSFLRGLCHFNASRNIIVHNILDNTTHLLPFEQINRNSGAGEQMNLYRHRDFRYNVFRNPFDEAFITSLNGAEASLEGAWITSTAGVRLPRWYRDDEGAKDIKRAEGDSADDGNFWADDAMITSDDFVRGSDSVGNENEPQEGDDTPTRGEGRPRDERGRFKKQEPLSSTLSEALKRPVFSWEGFVDLERRH